MRWICCISVSSES